MPLWHITTLLCHNHPFNFSLAQKILMYIQYTMLQMVVEK